MRLLTMRRLAFALIIIGAIASLLVALDRYRFEQASRSVEITIDQLDLDDFAKAYGYDEDDLLRKLRAAGLTSVAVYAEEGQRVNYGTHAFVQTGQQVIDGDRVTGLADKGLQELVAAHKIDPKYIYIVVYDTPTLTRYLEALRTQLEPRDIEIVRSQLPAILEVKTQIDFFNGIDLGMPADLTKRIRDMGLLVDPRVQNNERLAPDAVAKVFDDAVGGGRVGTVIFYGAGNEVLGYPYQLEATAQAFRDHPGIDFGDVEAYTEDQIQKGTQTLGRDVPGQTVRVMAIPKLQLDKLDVDTVIGEYLLGVRERNIRVVYYRPYPHPVQVKLADGTMQTESVEQTNIDLISDLADQLRANGFEIGRASSFTDFKSWRLNVFYLLAGLGVAGAFLLLLDIYGWSRRWMPWVFAGLTIAAFAGGFATGHDEPIRKLWALGGALTFGVLAGSELAMLFRVQPAASWIGDARTGLVCLGRSAGVALLGGLFITGLLSQVAFMLEVDLFFGVKALLVVPPLIVFGLYLFTDKFGPPSKLRDVAAAPVRAWMLAAFVVLAAVAAFLVMRSGNQPDIGVSGLELNVRGALTQLMGARPRFKEFLIGYPPIFLLAALTPAHRRFAGWLLVLFAAVGLADVLDTFSHIHTSLSVGLLRTINGAVLGAAIGVVVQWIYRRFVRPRANAAG
jgi:hypothetical protein